MGGGGNRTSQNCVGYSDTVRQKSWDDKDSVVSYEHAEEATRRALLTARMIKEVWIMKTYGALMAASLCLLFGQVAVAQDCCGTPDCCARCSVRTHCQQFACQVVCEVKKVKKTCWVVECEEFAPLLPGCRQRCRDCCDTGGCGVTSCGSRSKCEVPPRCGKARVRKKLVKKSVTVEVPVYKTVVQHLCSGCCTSGCGVEAGEVAAPSAAPVAPAPAPIPKEARQTLLVPMPSY